MQPAALRGLTRLVWVSAASEEGGDTRQRVPMATLDEPTKKAVTELTADRLLVTSLAPPEVCGGGELPASDDGTQEAPAAAVPKTESNEGLRPDGIVVVEVAHEALIRNWARLCQQLNADRPFLLWRQELGLSIAAWRRAGRAQEALLAGARLVEASGWARKRAADLNNAERNFILMSERRAQRPRRWLIAAAVVVVSLLAAAGGWEVWTRRDAYQIQQILIHAPVEEPHASGEEELVERWAEALVDAGYLQEALDVADRTDGPILAVKMLNRAAETQAKLGHSDGDVAAAELWQRALTVAKERMGTEELSALELIMKSQAATKKRQEVRKTAQRLLEIADDPGTDDRSSIYWDMAIVYAELGLVDEAQELLIPEEGDERSLQRDAAINSIVSAQLSMGDLDEALNLARSIHFESVGASAIARVALEYANLDNAALAEQLLEEAFDEARKDDSGKSWSGLAWVLWKTKDTARKAEIMSYLRKDTGYLDSYDLVPLALLGDLWSALDLAWTVRRATSAFGRMQPERILCRELVKRDALHQIQKEMPSLDAAHREGCRLSVAQGLLDKKQFEPAIDWAKQVGQATLRGRALTVEARAHCSLGNVAECLEALSAIPKEEERASALEDVAGEVARTSRIDTAKAIARSLPWAEQYRPLAALARAQAELDEMSSAGRLFDEAIEVAKKILARRERSYAFADIAEALAKSRLYRRARLVADDCWESDQLRAYAAILESYTAEQKASP
jgi:tetratricopeptide (TPR) repeat protein